MLPWIEIVLFRRRNVQHTSNARAREATSGGFNFLGCRFEIQWSIRWLMPSGGA